VELSSPVRGAHLKYSTHREWNPRRALAGVEIVMLRSSLQDDSCLVPSADSPKLDRKICMGTAVECPECRVLDFYGYFPSKSDLKWFDAFDQFFGKLQSSHESVSKAVTGEMIFDHLFSNFSPGVRPNLKLSKQILFDLKTLDLRLSLKRERNAPTLKHAKQLLN